MHGAWFFKVVQHQLVFLVLASVYNEAGRVSGYARVFISSILY